MSMKRAATGLTDPLLSNKKSNFLSKFKYHQYLPDLPIELLEEIIGKLTIWEFGRVRGTCKPFRNAADNILIRNLMNYCNTYVQLPSNLECICAKIYHQLTWPYLKYGYRSIVAGVFLSLIENLMYSRNSPIFPPFLGEQIINFYKCIDSQMNPNSQSSRLLFIVTVLGFLNKLPNTVRIVKQINSNKLKLNFIMHGSLMGLLWTKRHRDALVYPNDRISICVFLADIMTSNITETPIRKMWENEVSNRVFIFGNEYYLQEVKSKRKPRAVVLEFTISTRSNNIIEFLKTVPCTEEWNDFPVDNFDVSLHISCKEAHKLGCPTNYTFKI